MLLDYKILAVDFDGTLCEERWPEIGRPNHAVIEHVKQEQIDGAKLILWTCRVDQHLRNAIEWCAEHGIYFDAINDNLPDIHESFPVNGPKIYYDELIDDKNCSKFDLPYCHKEDITHVELFGDSKLIEEFDVDTKTGMPIKNYCKNDEEATSDLYNRNFVYGVDLGAPDFRPITVEPDNEEEPVEKSHSVSWAEKEIEIACKLERGESGNDEDDWDYGCSCYDSAYRAFTSLCNDGHSGFSIGLTQNILNRLIEHKPLTPIYDTPDIWGGILDRNDEKGYTCYQSTRMSALFKYVYDDGVIKYKDVDNNYAIDIHNHSTYSSGMLQEIMEELYPISMPYYPGEPTVFYCEDFLYDPKNGDYDTKAVLYLVRPGGDRVELNRFFKETKDGFKRISGMEYAMRKTFAKNKVKRGTL